MFTSTIDYNARVCECLGQLPSEIVGLMVGYVTTPGIDDLTNRSATEPSNYSIFGADTSQLTGMCQDMSVSSRRPTGTIAIRVRFICEQSGEVKLLSDHASCDWYTYSASAFLDRQPSLTKVPTIVLLVTVAELWAFICGDDLVVRRMIRCAFKSRAYLDVVLGVLRAGMRARLTKARIE